MTTGLDLARDESVERFRDWLKARQFPATPQRMAIAAVVLGAERPLSAEDVVDRLCKKGPAPGTATVYRTIDSLIACGLVTELEDRREGFRRFQPMRDDVSSSELLCTACGGVARVPDDVVGPRAGALAHANDFVPVRHRLVVYGMCAACRAEKDGRAHDLTSEAR
ncbi:transcriptional repressor [Gemmatimonadota bacterium]|nr:transcriptional repressor [Gemmatimonadota bacterium]